MIVTLQTAGLQTLAQIRAFVEDNEPISFTLTGRTAAHRWFFLTLASGSSLNWKGLCRSRAPAQQEVSGDGKDPGAQQMAKGTEEVGKAGNGKGLHGHC